MSLRAARLTDILLWIAHDSLDIHRLYPLLDILRPELSAAPGLVSCAALLDVSGILRPISQRFLPKHGTAFCMFLPCA